MSKSFHLENDLGQMDILRKRKKKDKIYDS